MKILKLLAVTTLLTSLNTQAAFFVVDRFEDAPDQSTGDGICAAHGLIGNNQCSLRAAIMEANSLPGADFIWVSDGEYMLNRVGEEDFAVNGDLDIRDEVTIINYSSGMVINANGIDRIFHVTAGGKLTLNNATLTNGIANTPTTFQGGAVKVEVDGNFVADEVIFVNNLANEGGALFNDGGALIENSYFHHNAITKENNPNPSYGGAIYSRNAMYMFSSTLAHNGQLLSNPSNAILAGYFTLYFTDNTMDNIVAVSYLFDSTIANNLLGGIRSYEGGYTEINHSTIANNGGLSGINIVRNVAPNVDNAVQLRIIGSLIANNHIYNCGNAGFTNFPNNLDVMNNFNGSTDASCFFTGMNDHENLSNPFNGSLHNWGGFAPTLMLRVLSGAVDGAGVDCTSEDQRGSERPLDGDADLAVACDIGALELNRSTDPITSDTIFKNDFEQLEL